MPISPLQFLMVAAGVLLAFGGLLVARTKGKSAGEKSPMARWPELSVPTRIVIGFCLVGLGYHLAVWAFPPSLTVLQVPRARWWLLVAGLGVAVALSLLLDRLAEGPGPKSPSTR